MWIVMFNAAFESWKTAFPVYLRISQMAWEQGFLHMKISALEEMAFGWDPMEKGVKQAGTQKRWGSVRSTFPRWHVAMYTAILSHVKAHKWWLIQCCGTFPVTHPAPLGGRHEKGQRVGGPAPLCHFHGRDAQRENMSHFKLCQHLLWGLHTNTICVAWGARRLIML